VGEYRTVAHLHGSGGASKGVSEMTNEQFKVTFTANNQLSAALTQITRDLDATYKAAGKTTQGVAALSKAFAPTAGMSKFAVGITNTQNALTTLTTSGLNTGRLNQISQSVTKLGRALTSLSGVTVQQNLAAPLSKLSKLTVTPLTNSMHKLAIASGHVSRNLNSIVKSMSALKGMGALHAKMSVTAPKTGGAVGAGGTTGTTGTASKSGVSKFASSSGWRDFEKTLHIFNSLTFAVGTVSMAFEKFYATMAKGNELTDRQASLFALVQNKGINPAISATTKYSQAMLVAVTNQRIFGGSLADSIDGMFKLQQIATSSGVSIHRLNEVVQLLAMRDPVQGIEGATIAVQELMSGDPMSLRRRFELPGQEINKLANEAGNAVVQLDGLTEVLAEQGITADLLNERLNTTAQTFRDFESVSDNFWTVFGQGLAQTFEPQFERLTKFMTNITFVPYYQKMLKDGGDDIRKYMDDNTRVLYEGYVTTGMIVDEAVKKQLETQRQAYEEQISMDAELVASAKRSAQERATAYAGLLAMNKTTEDAIADLTKSFERESEQTLINTHLQYALAYVMSGTASSATLLDNASLMLTQALGLSGEAARIAYKEFKKLLQLQLDNSSRTDKLYEDFWGLSLAQKEVAKTTAKVADETEKLNDIYQDTMERLADFDKEIYRKRIREMQSYYAEATLLQQKRAYEMRANDLDLVEGRNSKLEAADRQRLLARENIEAYGQLQINEAVAKANQIALGGNAKFAQDYLKIQEDRIDEASKLYQQLHDTQVRVEGDPAAQQRAKQIYDESIKLLDDYYNTKVGLADAAARQEREEEASQRRQIIDDAIKSVMQLENVDEGQRQAIIQGLEIAKTTITDLSNTYVDKVDAMRGSLNLLADALARVRNESNILTPQQLAAFNGLGMGQISAPPGGSVDVTQTTVNVGGINITVNSQVNAEEIRKIVLNTLQTQLNQRG